MTGRTCAYRDCSASIEHKHPTARFCSTDHKQAEHDARERDVLSRFWGRFGSRPRQRPAIRARA